MSSTSAILIDAIFACTDDDLLAPNMKSSKITTWGAPLAENGLDLQILCAF
jgi:hypothetical protein